MMRTALDRTGHSKAKWWLWGILVAILAGPVLGGFTVNQFEAPLTPQQLADQNAMRPPNTPPIRARSSEPGAGDVWVAKRRCHEGVLAKLKAPSTADFPGGEEVRWNAVDRIVYLTGSVDAQNSYGAKLRTSFVCSVKRGADDRWTVELVAVK